jgi:hypothetical protein
MLGAADSRAREIRAAAEKDARMLRQEAAREAGVLFEKLEALEDPLDALVSSVRGELDSLSTEFRRHWPADDVVIQAVPDEPDEQPGAAGGSAQPQAVGAEPEPEPQAPEPQAPEPQAPEPQAPEPQAPEPEAVEPEPEPAEPEPETVAADAEPEPEAVSAGTSSTNGKRGKLGWLKRRKSTLFVTTPGQCAVCYRSFAAGSQEALDASGWKVSGELGLCPQCQEDGWQLPEGARLPYRRAST